jgi:hypothetical protein
MYLQHHNDSWGKGAWEYHRATYGHQSQFGFKDICHLWKAEKFDTEATVVRMKNWGARFVTTMDKAGRVLYTHVFGNSAGRTLTIGALARSRNLFSGTIDKVTLLGNPASLAFTMQDDGLHVTLPVSLPFSQANVIRISTSGL